MSRNLPKISIITPSLNQVTYIEKTIQSVLNQRYPNLEYCIADGGSTDGTIDILRKYSSDIVWFSEKDTGQSSAINKALVKVTGDFIGYLNSDDMLEPDCLTILSKFIQEHKEYGWVTGKCRIIDDQGITIRSTVTVYKNFLLKHLRFYNSLIVVNYISQPATFWRKDVVKNIGLLNISLHYAMDYEYWLRIWKKYSLGYIDAYLASFRVHNRSKSFVHLNNQLQESARIATGYSPAKLFNSLHRMHDIVTANLYKSLYTL